VKTSADLYRYVGTKNNTFLKFIRSFLLVPGYRFIYLLRKTKKYRNIYIIGGFFWILLRRMQTKYGFQISYKTNIGKGFYIGHWGTIVVSHNVIIGNNCNINHGVTIGEASRTKKGEAPTIGDFVWMGTNSIIVGKIKIGNNVLIGPGAYVNFDVPDNSIVLGNPGKILFNKKNATRGYIKRVIS
jgi:serine O-acetyltransferase